MTLIGAATRRLYGPRALIRPRQSLPLRQDLTDFTPYTPFTARLLHESSSAPEAPKTDNTVKPPSHSVGRQDAVQLPDNKHALDEFKRFCPYPLPIQFTQGTLSDKAQSGPCALPAFEI
jgi:hypothetical protein